VIFSHHLHLTTALDGSRRKIAIPFGMEKLEWYGYPTMKKFWRHLYSFWQNVRMWQTDRRTDTVHRPRLHGIAWQKPDRM